MHYIYKRDLLHISYMHAYTYMYTSWVIRSLLLVKRKSFHSSTRGNHTDTLTLQTNITFSSGVGENIFSSIGCLE